MIYTITAIRNKDPENRETRCWGFYFSFTDARNAVLNNVFNFQDLMYDHAIIEVFTSGIPAIAEASTWYKWNDIDDKWESIDEPDFAKGIINWAMG